MDANQRLSSGWQHQQTCVGPSSRSFGGKLTRYINRTCHTRTRTVCLLGMFAPSHMDKSSTPESTGTSAWVSPVQVRSSIGTASVTQGEKGGEGKREKRHGGSREPERRQVDETRKLAYAGESDTIISPGHPLRPALDHIVEPSSGLDRQAWQGRYSAGRRR